ncbi:hypothetical protein A8L44_00735 [Bacillus sp. FJAT-27986]|nr:hypothetical protein A8L44_00735 [Bacillus sp. FJAT-27986]
MEDCILIKKELLDRLDSFKKQKLLGSHIIKRMEMEHYIENVASSLSINYKKESNSTNTVYYFCINESQLQLKFLFRYGTYYTRHQIINRYE